MEELNQKRIDRAVLVGLNADCFPKEETATETTLDELEALLNTAGGECAGKILQNKHTPDPRSFIGEGKAEEVRQLVLSTGANMVIFDNDLTPSQTRTLEDILKTTVLDRSALILTAEINETLDLMVRNLPRVDSATASEINPYAVLLFKNIVCDKAGFDALMARVAGNKETK